MADDKRTRGELLSELLMLRGRVAELEDREASLDASGNRTAAEAPRDLEERLRVLVDNAHEGIHIAQEGMLKFVNPALARIWGHSEEELLSRPFTEFIHPDDRELILDRSLRRAKGEELPSRYPHRVMTKDGKIRWLEINSAPTTWEGKPATLVFTTDITERKQMEEAIKERLQEIQVTNERLQAEIAERRSVEATLEDTLETLKATVQGLEDRNRQITLLNDLGDLLQSCLTREEAYHCISRFCALLFPHMSGTLFMRTPKKSLLLEAVATWGMKQSNDQVLTADDCWGLRRGEVYIVTEGKGGGPACNHLPEAFPGSYMCLPMVAQGETQGMLSVQTPPHDETVSSDQQGNSLPLLDRELAVTVARQISMALANLSLRESLHVQAIIDPLTGLYNRRYLEQTFEREIYRATRRQSEIGAIMVDIDHFKRVNDRFGHEAGDMVLAAVAGLLKKRVRKEDIPCRYGGEEFLIIFPDASFQDAATKAEQLRGLIARQELKYMGLAMGKITASFGVAGYPHHGSTLEEIIRSADSALFRAKEEGRDRVVVADKIVQDRSDESVD